MSESGERVVSVSIPIQHVRAVLGVLTLEAGDVDEIIAAERRALLPFILVAITATLISSVLLHRLIAEPVMRLARAADRVRLEGARAISLPDIAKRQGRDRRPVASAGGDDPFAVGADGRHRALRRRRRPRDQEPPDLDPLGHRDPGPGQGPAPGPGCWPSCRTTSIAWTGWSPTSPTPRASTPSCRARRPALDLVKLLAEVASLYEAQLRRARRRAACGSRSRRADPTRRPADGARDARSARCSAT
jgi:hypothetical protein